MKPVSRLFVSAVTALVLTAAPAGRPFAQSPGEYSMTWTGVAVGARCVGMGEAYAASVNDASGIFLNPASISRLPSPQVLLQYGVWLGNTAYHAAGFVQPLKTRKKASYNSRFRSGFAPPSVNSYNAPYQNPYYSGNPYAGAYGSPYPAPYGSPYGGPAQPASPAPSGPPAEDPDIFCYGAFGVGVTVFESGDIIRTTDLASTAVPASEAQTFSANSSCALVSYSHNFNGFLSAGATLKLASETLDTQSGSGTLLDAGVLFAPGGTIAAGAVIQNLGTGTDGLPAPQTYRAGIRLAAGKITTVSADIFQASDGTIRTNAGFELCLKGSFLLRGGLMTGNEQLGDGGVLPRGMTFGLGIRTSSLDFDIALQGWGALGHASGSMDTPTRISMIFRF